MGNTIICTTFALLNQGRRILKLTQNMIKKFLLAAMLIWCAAEGMAQERTLVKESYQYDNEWEQTTAVCDLYSDRTAVLKQYQSSDCNSTINLPKTVTYEGAVYTIVEVADNVFFFNSEQLNILTINKETSRVIIPDNASPLLKLGDTPFGTLTPPTGIELEDPDLFGSSTPTQAAVYSLPSLPDILTKSYDNSASYTAENMPEVVYLHIAYSLNIDNITDKHYYDGSDNGHHLLLTDFSQVAQNKTINIPVEAKLVFLDKNNNEDASIGKDKKVKLILKPTNQSDYPDFYEALIDNEIILDGYSGTITPMQLTEKDIEYIESLIKKALESTKIEDGNSDINCIKKVLTYNTEKYTVKVTIKEAKYYKFEQEVSDPGSDYDMKVIYEVDHNFCLGSTQTDYLYQKSIMFEKEGEITASPSVSDDDFATAFKAKYKNYLSKTYDGTTDFLGFAPQDDVLSVAVGSVTDAVAAQIKIKSVVYNEKDAGTRSLIVECTPVQGYPYTITSPVTITDDDIKITPFVLKNIADNVKEEVNYKKDKTYNGASDVEMNNPVFTIPGVTVNNKQETVGGTIETSARQLLRCPIFQRR